MYYSPDWCPHVTAEIRPKYADWEPGEDALVVDMQCACCGGSWRSFCYSGRFNIRVGRFAILHLECWHRPPSPANS